jgi:hypothetical protein
MIALQQAHMQLKSAPAYHICCIQHVWRPSHKQLSMPVTCPVAVCVHAQEVNDLRAGMEKAKNDIIKSTIAIMGTFSAIAFTITRLVSS